MTRASADSANCCQTQDQVTDPGGPTGWSKFLGFAAQVAPALIGAGLGGLGGGGGGESGSGYSAPASDYYTGAHGVPLRLGPGRAGGGSVDRGSIYPVGENGLEYLVPTNPGQILNQSQVRAAFGSTGGQANSGGVFAPVYNVTVNVGSKHDVQSRESRDQVLSKVRRELERVARYD